MKIRQLFDYETWTYSYLIWDEVTKEAAIIDAVLEQVERDLRHIKELDLTLKYCFETHIHADHITGAGLLRDATGAQVAVHKHAETDCADILTSEGESFQLGEQTIKILHTPGHTNTDITYLIDGAAFTGDTLFVRDCGRTDFQLGSNEQMYHSITEKLFALPDETIVYPAHDYKGFTQSTIGEEKQFNNRVGAGKSFEFFANAMDNLNLPTPKRLHVSVPGNMQCGKIKED